MEKKTKKRGSTSSDVQPETSGAKRPKEDHSSQSSSSTNLSSQGDDDSLGQNFKVFNDSVHGHIELHPLCVKIIDTPQFQRLRNIKQLGGCYFVYPSASHNRFEHCIGTSYLAGKLVKKLQKRQPDLKITDEDILCVQIAGLCHDLGHGPFSHMFDALFIPEARPDCEWKHENASIDMFEHMIEENDLRSSFQDEYLYGPELNFIKGLIEGKEFQDTGRGPEKSFLYEIVANKRTGIDVDKFDYFARDCHGLGINNSFDHKITEAFLKADKSSLMKVFKGQERKLSISDSIDDMKAYTRLTDHVYYHILNFADDDLKNIPDGQQQQYSLMIEARKILMRVEKRDLYKCIGLTILRERRDKDTIPTIRQEIAKCVASGDPLEPDDFVVDIVKFSYGMGDKNPIEEVGFYEKREPDKAVKLRNEQVSEMLPKTYAEQEMRVYFKRVDNNDLLRKAERCFKQWCEGQKNCSPPKGGDGLADMTPAKPINPDVQKMPMDLRRALPFSQTTPKK